MLLQAARGAVVKRLEWLDSNFLAALNAYLTLPSVQADDDLLALLTAIRHEVLDLVRPDGSTVLGVLGDLAWRRNSRRVICWLR